MDYIGSKRKLNEWIFDIIKQSLGDEQYTFLDACSGSGVVSRYAANNGYKVIANDIMEFPRAVANGSIGLTIKQKENARSEIVRLNTIEGYNGYFYTNFCDKSSPPRFYFKSSNAQLIDAVRNEIKKIIDIKVRDYLLYCGIEAISRISNTTGVQAAFLKKFKSRAGDRFTLREENIVDGTVVAFQSDILTLLRDPKFHKHYKEDILYIDPPYNQRQYGPNYHLYETFVRNDNPVPRGMTGLRNWKDECSSSFCTKKLCLKFLQNVIEASTAKWIYISYNSDGLLSADEIKQVFSNVKLYRKRQIRYKSDSSDTRKYNEKPLWEYLFEIYRD